MLSSLEYIENVDLYDPNSDYMKEIDFRSFIRGFITGSVILGGVGTAVYFINRIQSS